MASSNKSLIFKDIPVESIEEKCSFDSEFSLLESTLTELKDEHITESGTTVDRVAEGDTAIIENNPIFRNANDANYGLVKCKISNQDNKDNKHFDNCSMSCTGSKKCDSICQLCESVNVSVSDILVDPTCTVVVSEVDLTTNLDCSSTKIKESYDLSKNNEQQSSKSYIDNNLKSNVVISICDSSVEQCNNDQPDSVRYTSMIDTNFETSDVNEMELTRNSNIHDNNVASCKETIGDIKAEESEFSIHGGISVSNPSSPHSSHNPEVVKELKIQFKKESLENNTSLTNLNSTNCNYNESKHQDIKLSTKMILSSNDVLEGMKNLPSTGERLCDKKNIEVELSATCEILNNFTPNKNSPVSEVVCLLKNHSQEITNISERNPDLKKCPEKSKIYCSTPVISNSTIAENKQTPELSTSNTNDFGKMTPLNHVCKKYGKDLKRKFSSLKCIDEVDEDASDLCENKKFKYNKEEDHNELYSENEEKISSSTACFETPAKSILKKWQISSFSRNPESAFYIVDECGESDVEEKEHNADNASSSAPADDFEVACNSLNEELMKEGSYNIEELENYYTKVQLENQIDDEKFDEVLQELTLNYEINDRATQSFILGPTMDESLAAKSNETSTSVKTIEVCESATSGISSDFGKKNTAVKCDSAVNSCKETTSKNNSVDIDCSSENDTKLIIKVKENVSDETKADDIERTNNINSTHALNQSSSGKNMTIIYADGEDMAIDEEDVLLEEDTSSKKKPYEFFEYVSNDPKENEDNYNPEWQKLGRLTTDEERYKAVRDRWRSLVPPDPNRDLTCRQWRKKNQKPPLNLPSRNNNHQMHTSNERSQLCTAVFDMKIKKIIGELEDRRNQILHKRNMDFRDLGKTQDREQTMLAMRGGSGMDLAILRKQHIEECRDLKNLHDLEIDKITRVTEEKIKILKDASEEVMLFQKFYKGFGAANDEVCMYMTDIQVQELMETEEMLEQYTKFYK